MKNYRLVVITPLGTYSSKNIETISDHVAMEKILGMLKAPIGLSVYTQKAIVTIPAELLRASIIKFVEVVEKVDEVDKDNALSMINDAFKLELTEITEKNINDMKHIIKNKECPNILCSSCTFLTSTGKCHIEPNMQSNIELLKKVLTLINKEV